MTPQYRGQVALLVRTIPYIARETCFALKGGTAINLFFRDLPRLSVDIDLVYLGFEPRDEAINHIQGALARIAQTMQKAGLKAVIQGSPDNQKLIVSDTGAAIKVEPNYTLRGHAFPILVKQVSALVERDFGYAEMAVVAAAELFGGKICAALDRQHPRDLFDVAQLLQDPTPIPDLMAGFVLLLLSHNRPPVDLLQPVAKDQSEVFAKEFAGMTDQAFSYLDHQATLRRLVEFIREGLAPFQSLLVAFFSLEALGPDALPPNFDRLPAIQWKRQNLEKLRSQNPEKFEEQIRQIKYYFTDSGVKP